MAIVGVEMDQIRKNPEGDVSWFVWEFVGR